MWAGHITEASKRVEASVVVRTHRTCVFGHARRADGRPYSTFAQPPRHLHRNDQAEQITHWITAAMPWDARDDGRWTALPYAAVLTTRYSDSVSPEPPNSFGKSLNFGSPSRTCITFSP